MDPMKTKTMQVRYVDDYGCETVLNAPVKLVPCPVCSKKKEVDGEDCERCEAEGVIVAPNFAKCQTPLEYVALEQFFDGEAERWD